MFQPQPSGRQRRTFDRRPLGEATYPSESDPVENLSLSHQNSSAIYNQRRQNKKINSLTGVTSFVLFLKILPLYEAWFLKQQCQRQRFAVVEQYALTRCDGSDDQKRIIASITSLLRLLPCGHGICNDASIFSQEEHPIPIPLQGWGNVYVYNILEEDACKYVKWVANIGRASA